MSKAKVRCSLISVCIERKRIEFQCQGAGERERERETVCCCCDYWPATPAAGINKSGSESPVSVLLKLSQ